MLHIYVDADACPVKKEIYRVATRYQLQVTLVANAWMRTPDVSWLQLEVVEDGLDVADDWIAEHVEAHDIVITADVPLAGRCVEKQARVLGPTGRLFTENNIGEAVATRNLLTDLRDAGEIMEGPPPLTPKDRSQFLQKLDQVTQAILRNTRPQKHS